MRFSKHVFEKYGITFAMLDLYINSKHLLSNLVDLKLIMNTHKQLFDRFTLHMLFQMYFNTCYMVLMLFFFQEIS